MSIFQLQIEHNKTNCKKMTLSNSKSDTVKLLVSVVLHKPHYKFQDMTPEARTHVLESEVRK